MRVASLERRRPMACVRKSRHARLAHADDLADFGERQFFLVVERQDLPFTIGQFGDGLGQQLPELLAFEPGIGAFARIDGHFQRVRPRRRWSTGG